MNYEFSNKGYRFTDLCKSVKYCDICIRMIDRNKILSELNGNINSKVLFVAEAPGRLGADKTGVPLFGDRTGQNFEKLLTHIGWERKDIFITNAVLCNPRKNDGNNDTPTDEEVKNCSIYLKMLINLINPDIVITLGATALCSLKHIAPHNLSLNCSVGTINQWNGRLLFPMYHPGPRALVHRPLDKQINDFSKLASIVDPSLGLLKEQGINNNENDIILFLLITMILSKIKEASLFKLNKLLYLADLRSLNRFGFTLSKQIYLRQKEGPWIPDLANKLKNSFLHEFQIFTKHNQPIVKMKAAETSIVKISESVHNLIEEIVDKYGNLDNAKIKTAVYLTEPMKYILKKEKLGIKMLNKPVIYKNKTIIEFE